MDFSGLKVSARSLVVRGIAQGAVAGDKTVSVKFGGTAVKCYAARDITTATGDIVVGLRLQGRVLIIARLFASAPGGVPDETGIPDLEPAIRSGETVIYPVETRSFRPQGWREDIDDLLQGEYGGDNSIGCMFYGGGALGIAGATVTAAWLKVKRLVGGDFPAATTTLWKVTQATRPVGEPTLGISTTGPSLAENATNNHFLLPNSWAQDLVAGTIGGFAIFTASGAPYVRLAGRHNWSPSMALTIQWERVT